MDKRSVRESNMDRKDKQQSLSSGMRQSKNNNRDNDQDSRRSDSKDKRSKNKDDDNRVSFSQFQK